LGLCLDVGAADTAITAIAAAIMSPVASIMSSADQCVNRWVLIDGLIAKL
jgi:hypothetical protein